MQQISRTTLLAVLFISFMTGLYGQQNTTSPYSRFGLGEFSRKGFEKNRALGGIGLGLHDNNYLNYLNPASYGAQDTLSFLFNFGLLTSYNNLKTSTENKSNYNLNMNHLAIGFPLTKWWKTSIGILPFTSIGYSVLDTTYVNNKQTNLIFSGNGGINQLYLGTAFNVFKGLNIGINFSYLFGSFANISRVEFPNNLDYSIAEMNNSTRIHGFIYQLGIQYEQRFAEDFSFTLGAVYTLNTNLKAENHINKTNYFNGTATLANDSVYLVPNFSIYDSTINGKIRFPQDIGLGFTFNYKNVLLIGLDYYQQDWSKSTFFNEDRQLTNSNSLHAGLELTPEPMSMFSYLRRIHYRIGGYLQNSYLEIKGEQLNDYGISFGVGLPFRNTKTTFNFACETGRRGSLDYNLIMENYVFFSFSVTLHDFWFLKRRFD